MVILQVKCAWVEVLFPKEMESGELAGWMVRLRFLAKVALIKTEPDAPVSRRIVQGALEISAPHIRLRGVVTKGSGLSNPT